ncbi:hypothetical protein ACIF8T_31540 [Streptomyces sp. NPDC085946]|uniref:hypothetical protein n=1 Tax=Streptomyces sp. NPDC085946 TaxID=3365744 RepID=UPI0037D89141
MSERSASPADGTNAPDAPEALIRAAAHSIAGRLAGEKGPVSALRSVVHMVDNDEADLAVDDLARVIASYRIRLLRTEHAWIVAAAARLGAPDPLTGTEADRFVDDRDARSPGTRTREE